MGCSAWLDTRRAGEWTGSWHLGDFCVPEGFGPKQEGAGPRTGGPAKDSLPLS